MKSNKKSKFSYQAFAPLYVLKSGDYSLENIQKIKNILDNEVKKGLQANTRIDMVREFMPEGQDVRMTPLEIAVDSLNKVAYQYLEAQKFPQALTIANRCQILMLMIRKAFSKYYANAIESMGQLLPYQNIIDVLSNETLHFYVSSQYMADFYKRAQEDVLVLLDIAIQKIKATSLGGEIVNAKKLSNIVEGFTYPNKDLLNEKIFRCVKALYEVSCENHMLYSPEPEAFLSMMIDQWVMATLSRLQIQSRLEISKDFGFLDAMFFGLSKENQGRMVIKLAKESHVKGVWTYLLAQVSPKIKTIALLEREAALEAQKKDDFFDAFETAAIS